MIRVTNKINVIILKYTTDWQQEQTTQLWKLIYILVKRNLIHALCHKQSPI